MKDLGLYFLLFLLVFGSFWWFFYRRSSEVLTRPDTFLKINDRQLFLEIADTPVKKTKGLGGRDSLPENTGMLFNYSRPGRYQFWMMGMRFDLDFIFLNGNRIVDLQTNIPYPRRGSVPARVRGKENYDRVVEVPAGLVERWGIKIGQEVNFYL